MAHQIETFFGREQAWHGLGTITGKNETSSDAIKLAGLDWTVKKVPLFFPSDDEKMLPTLEAFGVIRSSDEKCLGIVGEGYNPVMNYETFEFGDALLHEVTDGDAKYVTAGSLFGGKRIFICAELGEKTILGDIVKNNLILTNSFDGSSPFTGLISPTRVVCANTLKMALKNASRIIKIRHTKNLADRVTQAQQVLGLAHKYLDKINEKAEEMVRIPFGGNILDEFIEKVFGVKEDDSTRTKNGQEKNLTQFVRALNQDDVANFRGTAWGVYQALSDFDSHREVARDNQTSKDRNFLRIVGDDTWLESKTNLMLEMAGV